jgi:hypothetical protein
MSVAPQLLVIANRPVLQNSSILIATGHHLTIVEWPSLMVVGFWPWGLEKPLPHYPPWGHRNRWVCLKSSQLMAHRLWAQRAATMFLTLDRGSCVISFKILWEATQKSVGHRSLGRFLCTATMTTEVLEAVTESVCTCVTCNSGKDLGDEGAELWWALVSQTSPALAQIIHGLHCSRLVEVCWAKERGRGSSRARQVAAGPLYGR